MIKHYALACVSYCTRGYMYCRNCGKQIPDGQEYCIDCEKDRMIFGTVVPIEKKEKSKKIGFMHSLLSVIASVFSFNFASFSYGTILIPKKFNHNYKYTDFSNTLYFSPDTKTIVFLCVAVVLMIFSVYAGIRGIVYFAKQRKSGKKETVATLILGIVGIYISFLAVCIVLSTIVFCFVGKIIYNFSFNF